MQARTSQAPSTSLFICDETSSWVPKHFFSKRLRSSSFCYCPQNSVHVCIHNCPGLSDMTTQINLTATHTSDSIHSYPLPAFLFFFEATPSSIRMHYSLLFTLIYFFSSYDTLTDHSPPLLLTSFFPPLIHQCWDPTIMLTLACYDSTKWAALATYWLN